MTVYIILFRGVGGATQLPTKPLREALTAAGFHSVGTYINSGNAFLKTAMPRDKMLKTVAEICEDKFRFTKAIYAPSLAEWRKLVEQNPFPDAVKVPKFLHAAVLEAKPEPGRIEALRTCARDGERIEIVDKVAYLHTPHGFGTSKLAVKFDKGIGVGNTARNWNTVLKLLELAENASNS
ncbi:DUF1697 domain-containing protein [Mesorhizobium sp. BAC0120]|uniref:DUF1697 domain-containing protein n=1 Tax=Mesorhizobium sp. BAC0120 TaxID=3090670 RepID=UPI00298BD43E|nr:DUF1697 domain-containing protein [Mesorhizobium sp. BAC0120]MDW6020216.1 DUF1697 domain-containing protein [Mesorhizobium sp. BAC0120]